MHTDRVNEHGGAERNKIDVHTNITHNNRKNMISLFLITSSYPVSFCSLLVHYIVINFARVCSVCVRTVYYNRRQYESGVCVRVEEMK